MSCKVKTKVCVDCGEEKPITSFYTNGDRCRRAECKSCGAIRKKNNFTINKLIRQRARGIVNRLNSDRDKNKCYQGVRCTIGNNIQEIYEYLLNFKEDFEKIYKNGDIPSVDRIDNSKGYVKGNIQIITFYENSLDGIRQATKKTSKAIGLIKEDWHTKEYKSVSECSRDLGIKRDTIIKHRDAGTVSSHGYRFIDLSNY